MLMMRLVMKLLLGLGLEAMESEEAVVGLKLLFVFAQVLGCVTLLGAAMDPWPPDQVPPAVLSEPTASPGTNHYAPLLPAVAPARFFWYFTPTTASSFSIAFNPNPSNVSNSGNLLINVISPPTADFPQGAHSRIIIRFDTPPQNIHVLQPVPAPHPPPRSGYRPR